VNATSLFLASHLDNVVAYLDKSTMREQRSYPTEAIIIKHTDLGEADRVLTILTPYKGKLRAMAKGSRRPGSKKAGHLELLCYSPSTQRTLAYDLRFLCSRAC
jgi:hypothetical protein